MPRTPKSSTDDVFDVEIADDPSTSLQETFGSAPFDAGRPGAIVGRRLAVSVPGAIGGAVLVCALAFGASLGAFDPASSRGGGAGTAANGGSAGSGDAAVILGLDGYDGTIGDDPEHPGGDAEGGTEGSESTGSPAATDAAPTQPDGTDEPGDEPDATDKPEPTKKPEPTTKPDKPEPTKKPEPTEQPQLSLSLSIKEGAVLIDWSTCGVDGADYYKVVRSTDSTVTWPTGDNDEFIAAVEVGGATKAWDEHAPAGKKVWYRVFCVRATDGGYKVLRSSEAKKIVTPEKPDPTPKPEPQDLAIEAGVEDGAVVLGWETCAGDAFSHYRILRKSDGEPSVIAEVEGQDATSYVDDDVEVGVTYHYLVQCKGRTGDGYFLLGSTEWVAVTVE